MHNVVLLDLMDTLVVIPRKPKYLVYELLDFPSVDEFDDFVEELTITHPGLTEDQFFIEIARILSHVPESNIVVARQRWTWSLRQAKFCGNAVATLSELRRRGMHLAIISNALPPTHRLIEALELYRYVDHVFLSCDVGFWKPNQRIFLTALKQMASSTSRAVMIGNKVPTDIVGAIDSGIQPILLRSGELSPPVINVHGQLVPVAGDLADIPGILSELECKNSLQLRGNYHE